MPTGERLRPQFHFTAKENWLNDPNGLVYYAGTYHLFFQHNPHGREWGNMTWGHALSYDLIHWQQLPHALLPDSSGTIFSGSAVVDWHNTAGLQKGENPTLVALYTAAGNTSPESAGKPFAQCLAYSHDAGMTWQKYAGNPVLPPIVEDPRGARDPKVFWHAPSGRWIMALYVGVSLAGQVDAQDKHPQMSCVYFYQSPDLKAWKFLSAVAGFYECPDLLELPVEGSSETRWLLYGADGQYWLGQFDGNSFKRESGFHRLDYGHSYYAAQTYSNAPDQRRILIAWLRGGKYPDMPFSQQMSFPTDLTLRHTPVGLRVHRNPVCEIESLRTRTHSFADLEPAHAEALSGIAHDLLDIEVELWLNGAQEISLEIRGQRITLCRNLRLVTPGGSAELPDNAGRISLRILVDRTSIEVFADAGREVISFCYLPELTAAPLRLCASDGRAIAKRLLIHELAPRGSEHMPAPVATGGDAG